MRWQVNIDGVDVAQFAWLPDAVAYLTEHHTDGVTNAYLASMTESN